LCKWLSPLLWRPTLALLWRPLALLWRPLALLSLVVPVHSGSCVSCGGSCLCFLWFLLYLGPVSCLCCKIGWGNPLLVSSCVLCRLANLCRPLRFLILGFYSDQKFSFLSNTSDDLEDTLKTTTTTKKKKTVSAFGGGLKQRLSHRRGFASCGVNTEAP